MDLTLERSEVSSQPKDRKLSPLLTIFTVPKPFEGEFDALQRNALASWLALGPQVEVILVSDSDIPPDLQQLCQCFRSSSRNEFGTPLLDEVFELSAHHGRGICRAFVNADIILDSRFVEATQRLVDSELEDWLAVGRRIEFEMPSRVSPSPECDEWVAECFAHSDSHGVKGSIVCKDYFVFPSHLFATVPAFAIGRGNWDNWMVSHSKSLGIPVVDIGEFAPVLHQKHGYAHVQGGRLSAYVRGPEACENQRLAGGRNLISGSTPNWRLDQAGIRRAPFSSLLFGKDLARFAALLADLILSRK